MNTSAVISVRLSRLALLVVLCWHSAETETSRPAVAGEQDPLILAEFTFVPGCSQLSVPLRIKAKNYRFGVATREITLFGKRFADLLESSDEDLPGGAMTAFRRNPRASLGDLKVRFPRSFAGCVLDEDENERLIPCDGVIGLDVLVQYVVEIDFDSGKIRFLKNVRESPGDRFDIISLQKSPRLCAVTVKAQCGTEEVQEFSAELESPDAIYVRSSVARSLVKNGELRYIHLESTYDSTIFPVCRVGTASAFTLGRFKTKDVRTIVHNDNVIGLGYLSRFVVTFDFANAAMYLRPGREFDRPDGYDDSGLLARMRDDALEVQHCDYGSPAATAGLREGDEILAINGKPVEPKGQWSLGRLLRNQRGKLRVDFRRDGIARSVDMNLPPANHQGATSTDDASQGAPFAYGVPKLTPRDAPVELPEFDDWDEEMRESGTIARDKCRPGVETRRAE